MKVHKGDTVLVIAGKDKGAKGKVPKACPERNRILVEGVNIRTVFLNGEFVGLFFGGEVSNVIKFVCLDPVQRAERANLETLSNPTITTIGKTPRSATRPWLNLRPKSILITKQQTVQKSVVSRV